MNDKFRVWDEQEKKYVNRGFAVNDDGILGHLEMCDNCSFEWIECEQNRYTIENSTGLKDKHGTEIFEGDRLSNSDKLECKIYWNSMNLQWWIEYKEHRSIPFGKVFTESLQHYIWLGKKPIIIGTIHDKVVK